MGILLLLFSFSLLHTMSSFLNLVPRTKINKLKIFGNKLNFAPAKWALEKGSKGEGECLTLPLNLFKKQRPYLPLPMVQFKSKSLWWICLPGDGQILEVLLHNSLVEDLIGIGNVLLHFFQLLSGCNLGLIVHPFQFVQDVLLKEILTRCQWIWS